MLERKILGTLFGVLFVIFFSLPVAGQVYLPPGATETGLGGANAVSGMVTLSNGQRLQRRVSIRLQTMTKGDRMAMTDDYGNFAFRGLITGEYTIVIDKEKDFEPYRQTFEIRQYRGTPPQLYMLLDGTLDKRSTSHALEVIDRNAHLQLQLIADLLDVSRIISGVLRLEVRPVDLGAVVEAALDSVRPAADAKKIQIRTRLAASARLTEGDPHRLQQIVGNLLANAVKFSPAGGFVDVDLLDAGDHGVRLRVQDDGAGIDPAFLPHVFERFRQADGSVSREHRSLGLGLAIVRHLVELHGGTVRAEGRGVGKGSTFTVELPRMDPDLSLASSVDHRQGITDRSQFNRLASLGGCRALVVDDEEDSRELIVTILTTAGANVQTASSAREALQHLDESRPDVLLADIGMPGADGYALIREVRRREAQTGRHLPAAAITAYAGNQDRERALAAGFDRHVSKPITHATIIEAVRAMCSGADGTS